MLKSRRAVSNIVATMLIFGMMIASMGVLYSQISPTLLGFDARSRSTGQEFVLLSITNEMESLISSPVDAQSRIAIVSDDGLYTVSDGKLLTVNLLDGNAVAITGASITDNIGDFTIDLQGSFQYEKNQVYFSRTINEDSLMQNDTHSLNTNFVSKVNYAYTSAHFEFFSLARIDVVETAADIFVITISIIKISFLSTGGSPTDFPIQSSDFTLRLRRQESTINTVSVVNVPGPISINHLIDSVPSVESYSFGRANPTQLTIKFIVIPILFSI